VIDTGAIDITLTHSRWHKRLHDSLRQQGSALRRGFTARLKVVPLHVSCPY